MGGLTRDRLPHAVSLALIAGALSCVAWAYLLAPAERSDALAW